MDQTANAPLQALGFRVTPNGYSFLVDAADESSAVGEARRQAERDYRRVAGAVIHVSREGSQFEVVMTLRTDGAKVGRFVAQRVSNPRADHPMDGLSVNQMAEAIAQVHGRHAQ